MVTSLSPAVLLWVGRPLMPSLVPLGGSGHEAREVSLVAGVARARGVVRSCEGLGARNVSLHTFLPRHLLIGQGNKVYAYSHTLAVPVVPSESWCCVAWGRSGQRCEVVGRNEADSEWR